MENLPNPLQTPELPVGIPESGRAYASGHPTKKQQSYGAFISIIIIVAIIVIGAFYVWGKRISEGQPAPFPASETGK